MLDMFSSSLPEPESFGRRIARRSCLSILSATSESPPSRYRPPTNRRREKDLVRAQYCPLDVRRGRREVMPNWQIIFPIEHDQSSSRGTVYTGSLYTPNARRTRAEAVYLFYEIVGSRNRHRTVL